MKNFLNKINITRRLGKKSNDFIRVGSLLNRFKKKPQAGDSSMALMKSRPVGLTDRLGIVDNELIASQCFDRLLLDLRGELATKKRFSNEKESASPWHIEVGSIEEPLTRYFYLKPLNRTGILIEESTKGWQVSLAEKINSQKSFIRKGEVLDRATLFCDPKEEIGPRVSSHGLINEDFLNIHVYAKELLRKIL